MAAGNSVTADPNSIISGRGGGPESRIVASALFAAPFVALLLWFHYVDVYHRHFSETGWIVGAYNAFRILFIFYLFWIVEATGALLLRMTASSEFALTAPFERIVVCFFAGAGTWHVGMFALGYLNLYTAATAIILTLPLVILSYGDARDVACAFFGAVDDYKARVAQRDISVATPSTLGLLAIVFVMLLLIKGLYPGGNHDYLTKYFSYFQSVVAHHGIWPNEVCCSYYSDKGVGLTFLGLLLTDPLAPQLVTFCYMTAAALVVFLACRAAAPNTRWPHFGAMLFLVIYIYTPNWAEFEKTHELATALVIGVIWAAGGAFARCGTRPNRLWPIAAGAAIAGAVIATPVIPVFLGPIFGILFIWYFVARDRPRARLAFIFAGIVGLIFFGTAAINYITTGVISDLFLLPTWRFSNIETLYRVDMLPAVLEITWQFSFRHVYLPLSQLPKVLDQTSRFDLMYPLVDGAIVVGGASLYARVRKLGWTGTLHAPYQSGILLAAFPAFLAIVLTGGMIEFDSFYRFASFMVPLVLVGSISLWALPISGASPRLVQVAHDPRLPFVVFVLCLVTTAIASHPARLFSRMLPRAAQFAVGAMAIDTAFTLQPFSYPLAENAIFPGSRGAYGIVGPGVPIWSLSHETYCMLPGCDMQTYWDFILPGWSVLTFGNSPEQGRDVLQSSGHNYFLFVRDLPLSDTLPLGPLFSPDNIARFLGIRWTDGNTALLTWLGPGIEPLSPAWIDDYRRAVEQSLLVRTFPFDEMKRIFARLDSTPHPWQSFALPWVKRAGFM
jgi:hypothetical protein